jgi:hypothetical protein
MKELTNKELLEIIIAQTKEYAKNQATFAGQVSTFMNEQRGFNNNQLLLNAEIKGYFESNPKTNQKGVIEQTQINTSEIAKFNTDKKVERRTIFIIVTLLTVLIDFVKGIFFK